MEHSDYLHPTYPPLSSSNRLSSASTISVYSQTGEPGPEQPTSEPHRPEELEFEDVDYPTRQSVGSPRVDGTFFNGHDRLDSPGGMRESFDLLGRQSESAPRGLYTNVVGGVGMVPGSSFPEAQMQHMGRESTAGSSMMLENFDNDSMFGLRARSSGSGYGPVGGVRDSGPSKLSTAGKSGVGVSRGRNLGGSGPSGGVGGGKGSLWQRKRKLILVLLAVLLVLLLAVAIPVGVVKSRAANSSSSNLANGLGSVSGSGSSSSTGSAVASASGSTTGSAGSVDLNSFRGTDGSVITMEDGTNFTYRNPFGGFWNSIPFDDSARPQSDIPPLNQTWDYATLRIQGVNLGGWLVLEPFISPSVYEPFANSSTPAIDEWTLCTNLGTNTATTIENHYNTFITEQDFAEIAGAGLNWVRIPFPFWGIETYTDDGEPFLQGVAWKYLLKAITWSRKYGLRINLDLHAVPGSQNGFNHSGKKGTINFMMGVMGLANAQRTLNVIRTLTEFVSQDQYKNVIPMFGILNEPINGVIGTDLMRAFYVEAYGILRSISGIGVGNGPMISLHDGFDPLASWPGFMTGADRLALDTHTYLAFSGFNNDSMSFQVTKPCSYWGPSVNTSLNNFGVSMIGEWCLAPNDCGLWVNGVGLGSNFDGTLGGTVYGSCAGYIDSSTWDATLKSEFQTMAYAYMDTAWNNFFWTWKTGNSSVTGKVANPMWSYANGLKDGYMPTNPRSAKGACASIASANGQTISGAVSFVGTFSAYMTGGSGEGQAIPTGSGAYPFPPASLSLAGPVSNLPYYTPTGKPITMSASTPSATAYPSGYSTQGVGNGWVQAQDTAGWYTPIGGCSYLNPWSGNGAPTPTAPVCGSSVQKRGTRGVPRRLDERREAIAESSMVTPAPVVERRY